MKTAIVYYSLNGNTEFAANKIAENIGADLIPVRPVKAYPDKGFAKLFWGGKSVVMGEKPKLQPHSFNAENYDLIIFGSPVWANTIAPPLRTFIQENLISLKGKTFAFISCFTAAGGDKALIKLKGYLGVDAVAAELYLVDPKDKPDPANEQKISEFCEKLKSLG